MKTKKEEEETDDAKFCSLKVLMHHEDKDSKTYVVKVKKYDSGTPEEFLKWCLISNEQTKTNGFAGKHDMIMNLAQAILAGRSLEAFLTLTIIKNKIRKANEQTLQAPNQIYDYAIFELAIRAFDIQSGWRDAYERQREYTKRDLFMGKLNPEKFSQRL
jgi:DNA-directed RNA polymerase subunit L